MKDLKNQEEEIKIAKAKADKEAADKAKADKEAAEKASQLRENGATALIGCAASRNAPVPCSRTSPQKTASPYPILYGRCGGWRIRPSIGSTPPSASCIPRAVGPRFPQSSCCWPCCCRRSTAFAPSGC